MPVEYVETQLDLTEEVSEYVRAYKMPNIMEMYPPFTNLSQEKLRKAITQKSLDWEYEKEWRIIYSRKQMYDLDNEILYGGNINFKCISAVYLGYRIHPEIRKNIQEICDQISSGTSPIAVYQAELSPTEYKIEYRRLN